jgi:hypothetical protein
VPRAVHAAPGPLRFVSRSVYTIGLVRPRLLPLAVVRDPKFVARDPSPHSVGDAKVLFAGNRFWVSEVARTRRQPTRDSARLLHIVCREVGPTPGLGVGP